MCARLYGRRSAKRRAERAIVAAAEAASGVLVTPAYRFALDPTPAQQRALASP